MKKCCCCQSATEKRGQAHPPFSPTRYALSAIVLAGVWFASYSAIEPLAKWLTDSVMGIGDRQMAQASEFFIVDTAKILLLIVMLVYVLAWLRAGLDMERVRHYLTGRNRLTGYCLGALFGAVTPFCSCSSIPLFLGFTIAGLPFGVTMAFLITSPLINEVAVMLFWGLMGWKVALLYVVAGLSVGVLGGAFLDAVRANRWLRLSALIAASAREHNTQGRKGPVTLAERHRFAGRETKNIVRRIWYWVIIGVALGALLHGFVPEEWLSTAVATGDWWNVPAAVIAGIPLYANVTGIVPVMESLLSKGMPLGTVLAFCLSTVAVSLPEFMILSEVMRMKLLIVFAGTLLILLTLTGWLLNWGAALLV